MLRKGVGNYLQGVTFDQWMASRPQPPPIPPAPPAPYNALKHPREMGRRAMVLGELALDMSPIGDAKAIVYDAPEQFGSGHPFMGMLSLASAVPFVPNMGKIMQDAPKEARDLWRVADDDIITDNASFATSREAAEAYLDNPGFGGRNLFRARVTMDPERVLDLYDEADPVSVLADRLGISHPGAIGADEWVPRISYEIRDAGIDWVRVRESYPADSETWIYVGADDIPMRRQRMP